MIKQCCWRNHSVMKNNDMKGVLGFRANLECRFGNKVFVLDFCVIPCCIGVGKDCSLAKSSETRVKSDRIHSVRFEAALINLSERFIMIYATEMIKACRFITRIGTSIPLNDPEKQFSCFVWVAVFFFSFFWLFFFPANTAVSLRSLLLAEKRSWRRGARIDGSIRRLAFLYPWKQNEEIN